MAGRTLLDRDIQSRKRVLLRALGDEIRRLREDAGLSRAAVPRAARIDPAHLRIDAAEGEPSLSALVALGQALGADLRIRLYPNDGPRIRDRFQRPMLEAFVGDLHARWLPYAEVALQRPIRGVVDLVLHDPRT